MTTRLVHDNVTNVENRYTSLFTSAMPQAIVSHSYDAKSRQDVVEIKPDSLRQAVQVLKKNATADMLVDLISLDRHGKQTPRFQLVYLFYSTKHNDRLELVTTLEDDKNPKIESIADLYPAANWAEREAFDMMGIHFDGHPRLKRILMWDEFMGHPLRKDYPLNHRQPLPVLGDLL